TEHIDMADLQPMTDAQASEHVFWQYRYHRRKWRRLTGKPVWRFRRHVRSLSKDVEKEEDDTKVMALGIEDVGPLLSHKMTSVHTSMLEGKEPDAVLEKATEDEDIPVVVMDKL
ncbi:MAG: hypothetical protein ACKPKO_57225, partial [Candidatus Fonsibacter sp.]